MGKRAVKYILLAMTLLVACNTMAQSLIVGQPINSGGNRWFGIAYIDAYPVSISWFPSDATAGAPLENVSNSDLFLRTSVYGGAFGGWWAMGYIQAEITGGGSAPPGMALTAVSAPCTTTNSGGTLGNSTGTKTLSSSYQTLVTNMSTSYTGTGTSDGYQITFTLSPSSYGQIVAGTYNVTVQFYINP